LAIQNLDPKDEIFIANLKAAVEETRQIAGGASKPTIDPNLSISGKVSISPKVIGQVKPTDTIFIYAKAMEGPKVPLAIIKSTADKLPMAFLLSDEAIHGSTI
jgi:cytochrome c-type biogenesis protein CcmH